MYLFGFGSLINLASAQKSFKRVLTQNDLISVKIKGYERVWNAIESIEFEDGIVNGVFLNIQKNENSILYGVVIKITEEELEILKLREKNYSCITIKKESILTKNINDDLIAFMTTKEDKLAKKDDKNSFIPLKYTQIVKNALENYDEEFKQNFKHIFENYPFALKAGDYTFTDPIQNKAAREGTKNYNDSK
ncbi:gamma-glutamylcyclotransferase [Arcobacter cloacae]|uniref:Gamma-glutamylcyclotransferase n=1 Tax=Arcobacter cloacae TaxID=1054034 RepID=A0A4Q0ZEE1_9BACT|nr:gamma-glutamylcyclotransferase [Arcobacter cloacae]RXJ84689.1 gamma-glutamylcyclotransferase [Arcobacter cloacae]